MDTKDATPEGVASSEGLGPLVEPVTLADVLDALNVFNRPKPNEDDGPWEAEHFIRVDYLPAFINVIAAAWFARPKPLTRKQINEASREGQISFCLKSGGTYEEEFARAIEKAHGIRA